MPIGPGARDQHVLADQRKRERRMRRVAEGVEDRREIVPDVVGNPERIECRDDEKLRERALAIDADPDRVAAQMPAPGAAIAAEAAGDVALARHAVAEAETAHLLPHLDHFAHIFVADLHRHGNRLLRPVVPFPDVDVGAADRGLADPDHDVVVPDLGLLHAGEREPRGALELRQCLHRRVRLGFVSHRIAPCSRPTFAKARTAVSICRSVCAALIWVRMRALPLGTTGYEKPIT